jgi:hypothetical protein
MSGTCLLEYVNGLPSTIPPYHPEFGYLCPSPLVRRSVRLALISGAIGMLIGAVAILSLLDKRLGQTSAFDQPSSLAETDRNDTDVDRPLFGQAEWSLQRGPCLLVGRKLRGFGTLIFGSKLPLRAKAQARYAVGDSLGNSRSQRSC